MVISHLPFNARMNHGEKTEFLKIWLKKAFDILDDKGYLIMLVPITFLYTKPFKELRNTVIKNYSLEQIIRLPKNIYKQTSISSAIVVIKNQNKTKSVLLSDFELNPKYINGSLVKVDIINASQIKDSWDIKPQRSSKDVKNLLASYNLKNKKTKLSDIAFIINGYSPKKLEQKNKGELLILSGRNIKDNQIITTSKDKYLDKVQKSNHLASIIQPGDILVTAIFENIKIYEYKDHDPQAIASKNIKIIRSEDDYLSKYLKSQILLNQFKTVCKNSLKGATIPYLTNKDLGNIMIYNIPLKFLIEHIENALTKSLSKESLIKSVLSNLKDTNQKAFLNEVLEEHFEHPILKLAKSAESLTLELKSSFRTNTQKPEKPVDILNHAVVKTVAAFANTKGGDLLIGVSDDNEIIGIEIDKYKSTDEFVRTVTRKLESDIKPNPISISGLVTFSYIERNGKTIVRVNVKPSNRPLYAYNGGNKKNARTTEIFYQRKTASSESLSIRESVRYIIERFPDYNFK